MQKRKMLLVCRCKDCMWWTKQKDSAQGRCDLMGIYPAGGWFCANGMTEQEREKILKERFSKNESKT